MVAWPGRSDLVSLRSVPPQQPGDQDYLPITPSLRADGADRRGFIAEQLASVNSEGGYDEQGNLFADGATRSSGIGLVELPRGGNSLTQVNIDKQLAGAAWQVQWDGTYLTVQGNSSVSSSLSFEIKGSNASLVGTTQFSKTAKHPRAPWIYKNTILVPFGARKERRGKLGFWKYPAGGKPERVYRASDMGSSIAPFNAVTVSIARK